MVVYSPFCFYCCIIIKRNKNRPQNYESNLEDFLWVFVLLLNIYFEIHAFIEIQIFFLTQHLIYWLNIYLAFLQLFPLQRILRIIEKKYSPFRQNKEILFMFAYTVHLLSPFQKCLKFFSQINHWVIFILLQCIESRASYYYEHKNNFYAPSDNLRKLSCSIGFLFEFGWIFEKCEVVAPERQIFQTLKLECWNNGLYRIRMKEKQMPPYKLMLK